MDTSLMEQILIGWLLDSAAFEEAMTASHWLTFCDRPRPLDGPRTKERYLFRTVNAILYS